MLESLSYVFKLPDLRKKTLFTLAIIAVSRLGAYIPVPGLDMNQLKSLFSAGGLLGFVDLFSGGALSNFSILSMGIIPYINASIIIQLLAVIMPSLKELLEEGEAGRKQVAQYTRYLTIALAFFQSMAIASSFRGFLLPGYSFAVFMFSTVISLVAGTAFIMWLAEVITEKGIGNGASLLIFVGIISRMPAYINNTVTLIKGGTSIFNVIVLALIMILVIVGIIIVQEGERKIHVQYAKRIVGNKMYGGQATYIPLKINQGGVLPMIFASSVLMFPAMLTKMVPLFKGLSNALTPGGFWYMFIFAFLIFFFTYFYTAITFNPKELADNIQKYGGFILGIRPGKPTAEYLEKILTSLTFWGALFLASIAILPMITANLTHVTSFMGLGGTALLIMVGVALDVVRQIDTIIVNKKYEGLIR